MDINLKDHAQFTLLHRLIHWGGRHHTEFITTLLNAGASPDVRDRNNRSALQVATRLGNAASAQALTHGGADVSEEDVTVAKDAKDPALHLMIGGPSNLPSIDDRSSFENAHRWCSEHNAKFLDSSFQPCLGSLVDVTDNSKLPGRYHDVEWVRAGEACKGNFSGAFDVTAGPLGDPFFIATLPDTPDSAFPHQMSESEFGLYEVTVQWMGETKTVLVDDFVPAIEGKPISAFSESGMMWPLIYEKACAKVAGSYQALSALRHGEKTIVERHTQKTSMPDRMQASSRRQYEVEKFMSPCLSAAMLGGFASNDQALASFASEFGDRSKVDRSKMLDGESRPMTTVGNFDMMQFPIKSPTKMVKVTSDFDIDDARKRGSDPNVATEKCVSLQASVNDYWCSTVCSNGACPKHLCKCGAEAEEASATKAANAAAQSSADPAAAMQAPNSAATPNLQCVNVSPVVTVDWCVSTCS